MASGPVWLYKRGAALIASNQNDQPTLRNHPMKFLMKTFLFSALAWFGSANVFAQTTPLKWQARILQLEDERNLNGDELAKLLKHASPKVRERAALAIGRIGDKRGTAALIELLQSEKDETVQAMAAFALGEMEDAQAVSALMELLEAGKHPLAVRARSAEALGKIIPPNNQLLGQAAIEGINARLIEQLLDPKARLTADEKLLARLTIIAIRAGRTASAEPLTRQLKSADAEIRALAANVLGRTRQPIAFAISALLEALDDRDTDVRANAARALGVSNDPRAVLPLINSLNDKSTEVEIIAIRSLAQLNDPRAIEPLMQLFEPFRASTINVMLEAAAALTALKAKQAVPALLKVREAQMPKRWLELETAVFKLSDDPASLFPLHTDSGPPAYCRDWQRAAVTAQSLAAAMPTANHEFWNQAFRELANDMYLLVSNPGCDPKSQPALFQAMSKLLFHPAHQPFVNALKLHDKPLPESYLSSFRKMLASARGPYRRAALAAILAAQAQPENVPSLITALSDSEHDDTNDAKLALLSALAKYKTPPAIAAIKTALKDRDQLVRRHAVNLLKQLDAGDFNDAIGTVQTGRTAAFYQQVVAASQQKLFATITTAKGTVKLELYPQDAPLTVNNFVTLARKGYFNGLTFHRVVPNFVIQGGDPRGDGEGGPGYAIRCEINTRPYQRGALGMALSGKDTGGSQWFITHAPQPHLDGGYTVFGQVVAGMNTVDRLSRDDVMQRVVITNR